MRAVRQRDLRCLGAFVDSLNQVADRARPRRVADGLHTLVPGVVASYNEFAALHTSVAAVAPGDAGGSVDEEAFARLAWQHPVLARYRGARSQPARAISDFASRRELERLELYQAIYRPLGIADQISIALPGPGMVTIGVAMGRERRGFTQRERLLLDLLRPHLALGARRSAWQPQLREARAALQAAASDTHPGAVVVLTEGRGIAWATPPARRLLREWFGYDGGAALPARLDDWITPPRSSLGHAVPSSGVKPLRLARGARRLTVVLLASPDPVPDGGLLLTLEQHAVPGPEQLARLGLTRREAEVLIAAARGLGEQRIARELTISRGTVNKHLEHIYRKLNVTDRAQAIAAAFQLITP